MANLASSKKRIKQNERGRIRNRVRTSQIKTGTRRLLDCIHESRLEEAQEAFVKVTKKIDQVAAKGTLHRNTAARKKSRLARILNTALAADKQ